MDQTDPESTSPFNADDERQNADGIESGMEQPWRSPEPERIYENIPIGLCVLNRNLQYIHINRRMAEINGIPAPQHLGRTVHEIVPAWAHQVESYFERVLQQGDAILNVEWRSEEVARSEPFHVFREHYQPLRDEEGATVGITIAVEDVTTYKQRRRLARESVANFRKLADAMPQLVWTAEPDGHVDYYNRRWREFRRLSTAEIEGWRWLALIHPDDRQVTAEAWQHALQKRQTYQVEHRIFHAEGNYRWYLSRAVPVRDRQGRIVKWYGTTTDIHEQKETERALRESEAKYRTMFELSAVGQAELDLGNGRYLSVNSKFREITGYDEAELLQMNYADITHPDDVEADHRRFNELLMGKQEEYVSVKRYVRKDGTIRWVEARARLIRDANGQPVRSLSFVVDITDRIEAEVERERLLTALGKEREQLEQLAQTLERRVAERTHELEQANEELKSARDLFYTLFHANPVPTAITRVRDGTFIDVNEAHLRYFGWERSEIGKFTTLNNIWQDVKQREHFVREMKEKGRIRNRELTFTHPSGQMRTALVSIELMKLRDEDCFIGSIVDITERVKAEQQLRRLASELVVAEQRERQRVAHVLHDDIQQMLYSVQLNLHILKGEVGSAVGANLEEIEDLVARTIDATRNLSAGLQSPALRNERLANIFLWLSHVMDGQYGLDVEVYVDAALRVKEETKRELISRVVRELLFNVVKHAGVQKAELRATEEDGQLVIEVIDEGVGFDLEDVSGKYGAHTGLGLNGIRERLALFGGQFHIESAPGAGTHATIRLPFDDEG